MLRVEIDSESPWLLLCFPLLVGDVARNLPLLILWSDSIFPTWYVWHLISNIVDLLYALDPFWHNENACKDGVDLLNVEALCLSSLPIYLIKLKFFSVFLEVNILLQMVEIEMLDCIGPSASSISFWDDRCPTPKLFLWSSSRMLFSVGKRLVMPLFLFPRIDCTFLVVFVLPFQTSFVKI